MAALVVQQLPLEQQVAAADAQLARRLPQQLRRLPGARRQPLRVRRDRQRLALQVRQRRGGIARGVETLGDRQAELGDRQALVRLPPQLLPVIAEQRLEDAGRPVLARVAHDRQPPPGRQVAQRGPQARARFEVRQPGADEHRALDDRRVEGRVERRVERRRLLPLPQQVLPDPRPARAAACQQVLDDAPAGLGRQPPRQQLLHVGRVQMPVILAEHERSPAERNSPFALELLGDPVSGTAPAGPLAAIAGAFPSP